MAAQGKKSESQGLSYRDLSKLEAMVERVVERAAVNVAGQYRPGFGALPPLVVIGEAELPASTIEPDRYLQIIDSRGEIVNVSIEKIKERLAQVVASIEDVAERAAAAGKNIANKVSKAPFDLEEITVGLSIKVEAGLVVVGVGGDVNLELKFVRAKGAGSGGTP